MRILHLSDTHLDRLDEPNAHGTDSRLALRRLLDSVEAVPGVDLVVVSGDVADDGSVEAYRSAREMLGAFAAARGVPLVLSTGNHDERPAFTEVLGSGHLGADGVDAPAALIRTAERAAVSLVDGYRVITLDSLVPGKGSGEISGTQLAWLEQVLADPAPNGTVLVFHHPPITVPGVAVQQALGLRNPAELSEAIRGSDVRLMLTGHFHLQLFGLLDGVPCWVTPGVVSRIDLTARPGTERAVRGASATLVDLGGPASPLFHTLHARDPHAGETAYELDGSQLADVIRRLA